MLFLTEAKEKIDKAYKYIYILFNEKKKIYYY